MHLTALTIKNFKGIDERGVRIEFAPITLLFGPNNAGKSTVIQALHLAREVFCHPDMDLDKVAIQGKGLDLGGFQDYVHKRQLDRVVRIALEVEMHRLPACDEDLYLQALDGWQVVDDLLHQVTSCTVEIGIRWNREESKAELDDCAIFLNGKRFTDMHIYPRVSTTISLCNTITFIQEESVPRLKEQAEQLWRYIDEHPDDYGNELLDLRDAIKDALPEFVRPFTDLHQLVIELGGPNLLLDEDRRTIETSLGERPAPEWGCPLSMQYQDIDPEYDPAEIPHDFITNCLNLFSSLVLGPGGLVREALHDLLYIGPLRSMPERREFRAHKPSRERWAEGLAAWDMLATATDDQLKVINHRLNSPDFLTTGYTIARKRTLPLDVNGPLALTLRQSLLEDFDENALPLLREFLNQSPEIRLALRNEKTGVEVDPRDMGVGISQVIPVVVAAAFPRRGAVIAIEQPELHIHPAWQTALGDIFIQAITKENPPLFLLETHSEHLMLRLLRRIRETYEEGLPTDFPEVRPEMLSVLYVQPQEDGHTEIIRIPITPDGDFGRKWPNGFFVERAGELF